MTTRCQWCLDNGPLQAYHDTEWGIPIHDDRKHFEFLLMEVMQCGLNWNMMLKKRETFRQCFDSFDYEKIAGYDGAKIQEILKAPNMIKSLRKINAVISNAQAFIRIRQEYGSFDQYLWNYSQYKTIVYKSHRQAGVAKNSLSDRISSDLKKRGFKYLGSITVYAHLQACGVINDHSADCFLYEQIVSGFPLRYEETD